MTKPWPNVPWYDDFRVRVVDEVIYGATEAGYWAWMTPASHVKHGIGLGQGRGQLYVRVDAHTWEKVEG